MNNENEQHNSVDLKYYSLGLKLFAEAASVIYSVKNMEPLGGILATYIAGDILKDIDNRRIMKEVKDKLLFLR